MASSKSIFMIPHTHK